MLLMTGASGPEEQHIMKCIGLVNQGTAAENAQDWPSLERFANAFVRDCPVSGDYPSARDVADQLGSVAKANRLMGKPEKALAASERCIETYYDVPSCHVEKGLALFALGHKDEGINVIKAARRMDRACVENERMAQKLATDPADAAVHKSWVDRCAAEAADCKRLLDRWKTEGTQGNE